MADYIAIAMRNCIIYFLNRRRETVVQIMIERRAPLLKHFGVDKALKIDLESQCRTFYDNEEAFIMEQRGIWKGEWEHYFHGHGCRLIHIQTKECFDWDASDPRYFRPWEFTIHLQWRMKTDPNNPDIVLLGEQGHVNPAYHKDIEGILDHLVRETILTEVPNEFGEKQLKLLH